jgi:two-component SAPR family response regulator
MTDKHRRENCEDDVLCSRKKAWYGNKEEITLIWLTRTELHTNNNEAEIILKQLNEINNYVVTFSEPFACIEYMKSIKTERIFLIIDGKMIVDLFEDIRSCHAIDSIYIFCVHYEKYQHLRNRSKIAGYFVELIDKY